MTTSNSKFRTGSKEAPTEPFKRAVTSCLRAIARKPELEVTFAAERPVIYAGQGVHYARAWEELKELAELLEMPVTTSLEGKSAFPENHPLALGSGGAAVPTHLIDR